MMSDSKRKTRITLHRGLLNVKDELLVTFFMNNGSVSNVSPILSKSGFATSDIVLQVTWTRKAFVNIPNLLICQILHYGGGSTILL